MPAAPPAPKPARTWAWSCPSTVTPCPAWRAASAPRGRCCTVSRGLPGGLPLVALSDSSIPPRCQRAAVSTPPSARASCRASPSQTALWCSRAAGTGERGRCPSRPPPAHPAPHLQPILTAAPRSTCTAGLWQCAPAAEPCPAQPRCPDSEFPCRTGGRCVPGAWLCDNEDDCGDGSDEVCAPRCAPHQHRCADGQCVPWAARCDGLSDCGDGSDERGCPPPPCAPPEFRCASGRCIPRARVCDGELDCGFADDSDEAGEWPRWHRLWAASTTGGLGTVLRVPIPGAVPAAGSDRCPRRLQPEL